MIQMDILEGLLGSRSRAEVIRLLFERPERELYLREIFRLSGLSIRPIQEELSHLHDLGLLQVRKDGNRLYYTANSQNPLFPELKSLVEKTSGYRALLTRALKDPEIDAAFVFGSIAAGNAKSTSDLDLFVVGTIGLRKLTKLLSGLSERLGREINPHVLLPAELEKRRKAKDHFVSSVMASKKVFLIGDENELKRLGKE